MWPGIYIVSPAAVNGTVPNDQDRLNEEDKLGAKRAGRQNC